MSQKSIEDILRMGRDLGDLINVDDNDTTLSEIHI
jgi:hypothetical protein